MKNEQIIGRYLSDAQRVELDKYLFKNLGVTLDKVIGYTSELTADLKVEMCVKPPHHYEIDYDVTVKAWTKIRIIGFGKFGVQPLGYSCYISFEIINPQIINYQAKNNYLSAPMQELCKNLLRNVKGAQT